MAWAAGVAQGLSDVGSTAATAIMGEEARDWAEKMRRTAYQVTVKDMAKAGLNPMLAYSHGPTPTTGVPPPLASFDIGGDIGQAIGTAKQAAQVKAEVETVKAGAEKSKADASLAGTQADIALNTQATREKAVETDLRNSLAQGRLLEAQAKSANANAAQADTQAQINRYLGSGLKADSDFYQTEFGQSLRKFQRVMDAVPALSGRFSTGTSRSPAGVKSEGSSYGGSVK